MSVVWVRMGGPYRKTRPSFRIMGVKVVGAHSRRLIGPAVLAHRKHIVLREDFVPDQATGLANVKLLWPVVVGRPFVLAHTPSVQLSPRRCRDRFVIGHRPEKSLLVIYMLLMYLFALDVSRVGVEPGAAGAVSRYEAAVVHVSFAVWNRPVVVCTQPSLTGHFALVFWNLGEFE